MEQTQSKPPQIEIETSETGQAKMVIQGRLDITSCGMLWKKAKPFLDSSRPKSLTVDAGGVEYCDGAGAGFLFNLREAQTQHQGTFDLVGLNAQVNQLLDMFDPGAPAPSQAKDGLLRQGVVDIGSGVMAILSDMKTLIAFTGELAVALGSVLLRPHRLRWKDAFLVMERAGCNAVGIVFVVSFLFGLILAFQSAIPLKQFGAQIFVVNILGIAVTRELGPLMTAIILAGRTGSAFAAELGTMKVNEELNALDTMGLEPVQFLIAPRIVAAVAMVPLLVILADFAAIAGGGLVMRSMGYTWVALANQLQDAVSLGDVFGGLFKSLFFGLLVAAIGCLRGLETANGAQAVGVSATRAVVSGIFLILLADTVFSVMFYMLGI
jgi:phospholipid/cholesterol/gamma-HCH transport system permease protein